VIFFNAYVLLKWFILLIYIIVYEVIIWGDVTDSEQMLYIQNKVIRIMTVLCKSKACYKGIIHKV